MKNDSLTGGTGDVSPQLLSFRNTLLVANTYNETQVAIPISRFQASNTRATVMEILKVFFFMADVDANNSAGGNNITAACQLSTRALGGVDPAQPFTLAVAQNNARGAFTAAGTYQATDTDPVVVDLTDGAGHGVLVATDSLFYGCATSGFTAVGAFQCKVLYRFKDIALAEYIGIVQSQQ